MTNTTIKNNSGGTYSGNSAEYQGGAVYIKPYLIITGSVEICGNHSYSNGGAVFANAQMEINGGEVHDNSAASGGGFYDYNGDSPDSYYSGGAIYANKAINGSGGAIHMYTYIDIVHITGDIEIYDNSATSNGGGVLSTHHLYITGGSIHDNTAAKGGGVYISGYQGQIIDITGGIIYDNSATGVNSGNDIALNTVNTDSSTKVPDATTTYSSLSMNAANTFTDTENNITGSYWYDNGCKKHIYGDAGGYSRFTYRGRYRKRKSG